MSRTGALVESADPVAVVAPPPPRANLPVGHIAALPAVVIVTTPPIVPSRPAGPCGPGGPAGPCGPAGPAGPAGGGAVKWALVRADGGIVAQSGGITFTAKPSTGEYILAFGSTVAGKLILTSAAHAGAFGTVRGVVTAGPCGSATEGSACSVSDDTSHIHVITKSENNTTNEDAPFYIAVFG